MFSGSDAQACHNKFCSPYKTLWQISKLVLKACTISLNALNYMSIF